ncbi:hypothetical protein BLA60_25810 [Actinophytocola xinjiangensis]|uniref:Uncharacterized protein n=1 Tax=Actinophytocola xinjiangensis TaxID=485602 RepID=A0A7Z1AVV5_9PSEU|nr:hypothetical protein BLA60_25810 [Actinophytocola xinjiangensis]
MFTDVLNLTRLHLLVDHTDFGSEGRWLTLHPSVCCIRTAPDGSDPLLHIAATSDDAYTEALLAFAGSPRPFVLEWGGHVRIGHIQATRISGTLQVRMVGHVLLCGSPQVTREGERV